MRNGRAHAIPKSTAELVQMALKHPSVRLELGINSKVVA
jgi:hypothetical protein